MATMLKQNEAPMSGCGLVRPGMAAFKKCLADKVLSYNGN